MRRLRGGMRITMYQCTVCGGLEETKQEHLHDVGSDRRPDLDHVPMRRVRLHVLNTGKVR